MFDIAYVSEVSVEVARKEKSKFLWDLVFLNSPACIPGMSMIKRYDDIILYWQFIIDTHGGC